MTSTARRLTVGGIIVAVTLWGGSPPAMAHEFKVVLVESDTEVAADARRGFRLAVDQSPDVSHPPDEEAGDHLGGVDVDIVSVQVASPSVAEEVTGLLDAGASAVIVLATGHGADAAIASAASRRKMVVTMDTKASRAPVPGVITLRTDGPSDEGRFEAFVDAYAQAAGSKPTEASALGYDAGVLLDAVVRELGEDLAAGPALAAATNAAADQLILARPETTSDGSMAATAGNDKPRRATGSRASWIAATLSGVVVVGAAAIALRRARRGRPARG